MPGSVVSPAGRRVRTASFVAGVALLASGTAWGQDDHFPFGPFRMYSTADDPNGVVRSTYLWAVDAEGAVVERVAERHVGLRRAEYEGQLDRLVRDPQLLADLAGTFRRRHPGAPPWVELRVVQTSYVLVDGEPTDEVEAVLATWRAEP